MYTLRIGNDIDMDAVLAVYRQSTLGERRPIDDITRMTAMVREANLVITAWDNARMIGIARCLTDFVYVTYLADLAVSADYQRQGIGRALIEAVRTACGPDTGIILLSAPAANTYYPRIGMKRHDRCWVLNPGDELLA